MNPLKLITGELESNRRGPWLTPVMWAGIVGGASMLLLALEALLGFGPEVRAMLLSICGAALLGGLFNARQWDMSSEGREAPMAPPPKSPTEVKGTPTK